LSVGERLYQYGKVYQQNKASKKQEMDQLEVQRELQGVTFHPQISQKSLLIMANREFVMPEDYLMEEGVRSKDNKQATREYYQKLADRDCTYSPHLNKKTLEYASKYSSKNRKPVENEFTPDRPHSAINVQTESTFSRKKSSCNN